MRIVIVEDEALLALELECEVEAAGHTVVGQAMNSDGAVKLIDDEGPDFAFVDVHLLDGPTGIDVGRHLTRRGIPFVFVTGNLKRIPEDFVGALGAIEKPYTVNGLQNALAYICGVVENKEQPAPPASLVMAPA